MPQMNREISYYRIYYQNKTQNKYFATLTKFTTCYIHNSNSHKKSRCFKTGIQWSLKFVLYLVKKKEKISSKDHFM